MRCLGAVATAVATIAAVIAPALPAATAATPSNTITVAINGAPTSLDPALDGNTADDQLIEDLAYEPLVFLNTNGTLSPGLAASWKYANAKLTVFDLTLRQGVRFSDGELLTASDVVASLHHEMTSGGPVTVYIKDIASAHAIGEYTVQLDLAQSNPYIALLLTQRFLIGDIIGPKAASHTKVLGTTTDGAGPYELDASATIQGSKYVFVPNPYYYDKSAVHFKQFIVTVITNPQTALSSLESGQISYADGTYLSIPAAKSAGLSIYPVRSSWYGVCLLDRSGALVPALKSQLVREALNYAIDRPGITEALFGGYGTPSDELLFPGYQGQGYVPNYTDYYTFNIAKAKQLLAQAGYPKGFTMTIGATADYGNGVEMAEAIAADWSKIGVVTKIDSYPNIDEIVAPWEGKKLPATACYYDGQPMFIMAGQLLAKNAGLFNIFGSSNPKLMSDITAAYNATTPSAIAAGWSQVERDVVTLGWEIPIATAGYVYFANKDVKGIALSPTSFAPDPVLWSA